MVAEPESIRRSRFYSRERDRLMRRRDQMLFDAYAQAQQEMQARIEADIVRRKEVYGTAVFDEEAARMLDVEQEMAKLSPRVAEIIHQGMDEQVRLAVEAAESQIEAQRDEAGVGVAFGRLNKPAVDQLATRVTERRNISSLLDGHVQEYKQKVSKTLVSELIQGKNPKEAARVLVKQTGGVSGGTLSRWLTVARTEMMDANREGLGHVYQQNSDILRGKERMATLDERTCMACVFLDGTVYPLDAPEDGHQNCRCTWLPVLKSRKDFGPKDKRLIGSKWFKKQPDAVQQKMMGMQKWTYWKRDVIELKDMVVERDNPGWRPAKYEASLKDALSLWDRTPVGRLMSELKRLPVIGHVIPWLFTPADEVFLLAWHGRAWRKIINTARAELVGTWATPAMLESGFANLGPMQQQVIRALARIEINKATEGQLFKYYRGGFPRILLPTRGPIRNIDNFMHSRMQELANVLQGRLENILLKGFEQAVVERSIQLKIETYTKEEFLQVVFDRYAGSIPLQSQMMALPAGSMEWMDRIPVVVDEFTPWGDLATDLRAAAGVTPGEGYLLSGGVYNSELVDATYETLIPGRFDPLRAEGMPNGGVFFSRITTTGTMSGTVYWHPEVDMMLNNRVADLKLIFDAAIQSTGTLPYGWEAVGSFTRSVQSAGRNIYHNSLNLEEKHQGLGFAEAFYQRSWIYYIAHGVESVSLSTANIGSYTWAKNWMFQFGSGYTAIDIIRSRKYKIRDAIDTGHFTKEDLARWLDNIVAREDRGDPIRSHELAHLGIEKTWVEEDRDGIPRRMHFGKMLMIGSGWSGSVRLTPPTENSRFGVPWPIPETLVSRYPRILTLDSINDLGTDVEQVLRAWLVAFHIESAWGAMEPPRLMLQGQGVQIQGGRSIEQLISQFLIDSPTTDAIRELRTAVEDILADIRNVLTENPGGVTLVDAVRQALLDRRTATFQELENYGFLHLWTRLVDRPWTFPEQIEEWIQLLAGELPSYIRNPSPPDEPPPVTPSVPTGGPTPPAPAPAPAGATAEPFRPLQPPPVLNPWARVMTDTEAREAVRALGSYARRTMEWEPEDMGNFLNENRDVFTEIFTQNQLATGLRMIEADLSYQLSRPASQSITRSLQAFLSGYLSTSPFEWANINLWSHDDTTMNAVAHTLNRYGITPIVITQAEIQNAFQNNGLDMAETVRDLLFNRGINMAVIQTIFEALKYQGMFVPESSRRLQSRAVPSVPPDYESLDLGWGTLSSPQREAGRRNLIDQIIWAFTDNLPGEYIDRRLRAEAVSEPLADLTIQEMINGLSPEAAMRSAWRQYQAGGGAPETTWAANSAIQRVTRSEVFQPVPRVLDRDMIFDAIRPLVGEFAGAMADRIAANPDRPLQIAQEEASNYVAAQPNPIDYPSTTRRILAEVQTAIGYQGAVIDPALRRRVRQIFGDIGLYLGAAPATRLMEAHFVEAVTTQGVSIAAAIRYAIQTVNPHILDDVVSTAISSWRQRPLAQPMPVLNLSLPENRAVIRAMARRIDTELDVHFGVGPNPRPVDEEIAHLNADYMPDVALLQLLEQVRVHFGRPGLVSEQVAVDPIPHYSLIERTFNEEVALRLHYAYIGERAPPGEPGSTVRNTYLHDLWTQYRNNEILRFPIDVDVRLRRALDIVEVPGMYDSFRHRLSNYPAEPLRDMAGVVLEGWSPETIDHLTYLIEADPVLAQYARPAPTEFFRFTYPERTPRPNPTLASSVQIYEAYYDGIEDLYDSGESDEFVNEALQSAFDSYYDGSLRLLPLEVTNELDRIVQATGQTQSHLIYLQRFYSGADMRFDDAIHEWLDVGGIESADEVIIAMDSNPVIRRFREIDNRPPPLWQPIDGGRMAGVIDYMIEQSGVIVDVTYRSPAQRTRTERTMRALLNRLGLGGFTVEAIANIVRATFSATEVWQDDQRIVEVAERMQRMAREVIRQGEPQPHPTPSPAVFIYSPLLPEGWYRIDERTIQRIVITWANLMSPITGMAANNTVRYVNRALAGLRAPFEINPARFNLGRRAHILDVVTSIINDLADHRLGLQETADVMNVSTNDVEIRDIYEYWLELLFDPMVDAVLDNTEFGDFQVVVADPDAVRAPISNLTHPGEWSIDPTDQVRLMQRWEDVVEANLIDGLQQAVRDVRLRAQVVPENYSTELRQSIRNRISATHETEIAENAFYSDNMPVEDYLDVIFNQIPFWEEISMVRVGIMPLVQMSNNIRVAGLYRVEPLGAFVMELFWEIPTSQIDTFRRVLESERFQIGDVPSDYHDLIVDQIIEALISAGVDMAPDVPRPAQFGMELIEQGRPRPPRRPGQLPVTTRAHIVSAAIDIGWTLDEIQAALEGTGPLYNDMDVNTFLEDLAVQRGVDINIMSDMLTVFRRQEERFLQTLQWVGPSPDELLGNVPPDTWQDLRHAIINLFTDGQDQFGFDVSGTHANQDEIREWYNAINDLLPEVISPDETPSSVLNYVNDMFRIYANERADIRPAMVNLPEWRPFWDSLAYRPPVVPVEPEPAPIESTWEWEGGPVTWEARLPGDYVAFLDAEEAPTMLNIYPPGWTLSSEEDPLYDNEFHGLGTATEQLRWATDMVNGWLRNVPDLPATVEPVLPARFPARPSDPYQGVVPEQFREESVAIRNLFRWRAVERADETYAHARDVLRRYMESRMAGNSHLQALAEIHEDLEPGVNARTPEEIRQALASLHNDFMTQLMGGNRYGGAPDQPRTIEEVEAELQQMGTMQRPLGPDPEEIRLLREVINERLTAGMVPFQSDLQELAELTGASVYETLQSFLQNRNIIDPQALREYLLRRMAAGFDVDPLDPYVQWLSEVLHIGSEEVIADLRREIDDQPGPGTAANPPDPLLSEENPAWTITWEEYRRRLEAVPNAMAIQSSWNDASGIATIEDALRQALLEAWPENDERWDLHRPTLGASLRELRDLSRFTQEQLRSLGITHIRLHRGEEISELEDWARERLQGVGDGRFLLTGRSASSWSLFSNVAETFGGVSGMHDYSVVFEALVPIEQVAFMFPSFIESEAEDRVSGLNYPTFGEFVVVGDIYADVTIHDNETGDMVEPTTLEIDTRTLTILNYLTEMMQRHTPDDDQIVQLVRAAFEANNRRIDRRFWQSITRLPQWPTNIFGKPERTALSFVETQIKRQFAWIPTISKAVQLSVLKALKEELFDGDPNVMWRVLERWRQLVAASVEPKEAFKEAARQSRLATDLYDSMAPIWQALDWEMSTLHTPLVAGDVILTQNGRIARVAFDEVIDEVEGWRLTNLLYLNNPMESVKTRIDLLGPITRPGIRWITLDVAFQEQARRAALAGAQPGERVILVKSAMRSWNVAYVPEHMVDQIDLTPDPAGTYGPPEFMSLVQTPLPPTPRVGSNILLDDQNAHLSFLDERDDYVVRLLNEFPDPEEAYQVAQLYNMWKGEAMTYRVQAIYAAISPESAVDLTPGLTYAEAQQQMLRDKGLLDRMVRFAQEDLRRRGITHVRLFRGLTEEQVALLQEAGFDAESEGEEAVMAGRVLSSWSIYRQVALLFAQQQVVDGIPGVILTTVVPVEKVAMVFPPFPLQGGNVIELVEGEFALIGDVESSVHSWTEPAGMALWDSFINSDAWDAIFTTQSEPIKAALGYIMADIGELIYTVGLGVDGAFDRHMNHEEQFGIFPGDPADWEVAFDMLREAWDTYGT